MRIGELLMMNGLITAYQLEKALIQQRSTTLKLGELLIKEGAITERQLVEALEFQHGISIIGYEDLVPDPHCSELVPIPLLHKHRFLPLEAIGSKLKVAVYDPSDQDGLGKLRAATGMELQTYLAARSDLEKAIEREYGTFDAAKELHTLVQKAVQEGSDAISFDPASNGEGVIVTCRTNGKRYVLKRMPGDSAQQFVRLLRIYAGFNEWNPVPQEGAFQIEIERKEYRIGVFLLPHSRGVSIVLQLKEQRELRLQVEQLEIEESKLSVIRAHLRIPGLVLFTSASGQGRSSLLYSFARTLAASDRKMLMLREDETIDMENAYQVPCLFDHHAAQHVRAAVLQYPDTLVIGSMSRKEMVEEAVQAVWAGAIVMAGVRSSSALGSVNELLRWGVSPWMLAQSLKMVVHQRLLRKVCTKCTQTVAATDEEMHVLQQEGLLQDEVTAQTGGRMILGNFRTFVNTHKAGRLLLNHGQGCKLCGGTGYKDVVATHEVLVLDEELKKLIAAGASCEEMETSLRSRGYMTHRTEGLQLVKKGVTTFAEAEKKQVTE